MSLGLRLSAKLPVRILTPDKYLDKIEDWIRQNCSHMFPAIRQDVVEGTATLYCQLHPAAEEIVWEFVDAEHIITSANTTTVGPGYHIFLTEMLKKWAHDFGTTWEPEDDPDGDSYEYFDETGFFFSGDQARLYEEMTAWLQGLAGLFFEDSVHFETQGNHLCMRMNPHFKAYELAITSLGPRSRAWLYEASQDSRKGSDFFAWWVPGFNAEYYLRRALVQMWSNVRWRPPAVESERRVVSEVMDCLRRAYALDPTLPFPWAEWEQIADYIETYPTDKEWLHEQALSAPTIGYRRRDVSVGLPGGWSMRLPGSFSDFEPDEEGNLLALDPPREIWFTAYQRTTALTRQAFEAAQQMSKKSRPEFVFEGDNYFSEAKISQKRHETGEDYFVLSSSTHALAMRAVCTIVFSELEHREWAVRTWQSLRPPSDEKDDK